MQWMQWMPWNCWNWENDWHFSCKAVVATPVSVAGIPETRIASLCEISSQHALTWLYLELCFAACTSDTPMHQYLWMIMIDKRVRLRWQSNTTRQGWWVSPGVAGALVCRVRGACNFTGPETRVLRNDSFESKKFKTFFTMNQRWKKPLL